MPHTARGLRLVPALGLALAIFLPSAPAAGQHFPPAEDLELMLRFIVEDGGTPGIVLGVLDADGSTSVVSYGSGGPDARPLGPRSVFEIGSITKTFTATLLADMALRGEVGLDDPLSLHVPEHVTVPVYEGREITLLDLATHRAGLPGAPPDFRRPSLIHRNPSHTVEHAHEFLSTFELRREPGERYLYSNFGYGLLGHALAHAAGTTFEELVRARILEPLGMRMTGFAPEGEMAEWMTRGHRGVHEVGPRFRMEIFDPAGVLHSTVEDLLVYMRAQIGPPESELERAMRLAHEVRVPTAGTGAGHGLAWTTAFGPRGERILTHSGGTTGFSARLVLLPDAGIGTVLLTNQRPFDDDLAISLLLPEPPPPEWTAVPVERTVLERYAGEYVGAGGNARYFVRLEEEGYLTYQPRNRPRARMYATSDTTFHLLRGPWSFTFRVEEGAGEVAMLMEVDEMAGPESDEMESRLARRTAEETPPPAVVAGHPGPGTRAPWGWLGLAAALVLVVATRPLWSRSGPARRW